MDPKKKAKQASSTLLKAFDVLLGENKMSKLRKTMPPATTKIPDKKKEANKKICREKIEFDSNTYIVLKNEMIREYVDRLIPCKERSSDGSII